MSLKPEKTQKPTENLKNLKSQLVAFEKLKFMARQYVEPLAENRQNIVKQSLYFHELKSIKSREIQNIIISVFVESRRDFWHQQGVPKELENSKFKLE